MIMNNEGELLQWPCGVPTISEIDQAREMEEEVKFICSGTCMRKYRLQEGTLNFYLALMVLFTNYVTRVT